MRVVVAMSGGVDSSVAALLLKETGHEVTGVFLRNGVEPGKRGGAHKGCCSAKDACDALEVAGILGIPFYSLDHSQDFARIVDAFVEDYASGRTPNPCVLCNRDLKFGEILKFAQALGATHVASGHYARLTSPQSGGEGPSLRRALDRAKDQSYVLSMVPAPALERTLFPLGELTKAEVRRLAEGAGLPVFDKEESQEICFVPSGDYRDLLRERRPELFRPGELRDPAGRALGMHTGSAGFTVGQRKGIGLGGTGPYFVVELQPEKNAVVVGRAQELMRRSCVLEDVNWLEPRSRHSAEFGALLQVRAHQVPIPAILHHESSGRVAVRLPGSGAVLTPGQIGALYEDDRVLAAGRIAIPRSEDQGEQ